MQGKPHLREGRSIVMKWREKSVSTRSAQLLSGKKSLPVRWSFSLVNYRLSSIANEVYRSMIAFSTSIDQSLQEKETFTSSDMINKWREKQQLNCDFGRSSASVEMIILARNPTRQDDRGSHVPIFRNSTHLIKDLPEPSVGIGEPYSNSLRRSATAVFWSIANARCSQWFGVDEENKERFVA